MRDHIIICGLGRKGVRLVNQFRERDEKMIVIEPDERNDWIETSRSSGAIVLNGDASDPGILRKARLNHARYLISVVGDDGKNAEVAAQAEKISRKREHGTLTCSIHIVDPQLWYLLREKEFDISADSHFRLELFNIFDRGARLMLKTHSPWTAAQDEHICDKRLVLIGMGNLGQSLVIQATSQWREHRGKADQRLRFTIIDLDAEQKKETLCARYPNLEEVSELEPLQMDVHSGDFQRGEFLYDEGGTCDVASVYVCMDNNSLSLHTGLTLYQKLRDHQIPVIVRMVDDAGLALLLHEEDKKRSVYENLHAFPLLDQTCTPDLILRGTHEVLARELHAAYLEGVESSGKVEKDDPSQVPWEKLSEYTKEKNRNQADHIPIMLDKAGYRIIPLRDWDATDLRIEDEDVTIMAPLEHARWCQEKISEGWRLGPVKDDELKTNPNLVPWEELQRDGINKNKKFIRDLPRVLARAGFQIERQDQKRSQTTPQH